jgi:RHS repeat-associated protein
VIQPGNLRTEYEYDYHGNLQSVTDAEGHHTVFEYDDMGRLLAEISPDRGTTTYIYDSAGNVMQKSDGNGIVSHYTYDALNRLVYKGYPDAAEDVSVTYDAGANGNGRRTGIANTVEQTAFEYDRRGRLSGEISTTATGTFALRRSYSAAGRLLTLTYPSGRQMDYNRYANGKIEGLYTTFNGEMVPLISGLDYNPFGTPTKMDTGNNGTVDNQSGDCGCLEVINPGQPMEQRYTYDDNRNLISIVAPYKPWYNQGFSYDTLGRLIRNVGRHGTIEYTYDKVGNRLTRTVAGVTETFRYLEGTNRLAQFEGPAETIVYDYDASGNVIGAGTQRYTYNQGNRLIAIGAGGKSSWSYGYNALGQRVYKDYFGLAERYTQFHYDFDGNVIGESNAGGDFISEYIYFAGTRIAKVDVRTDSLYYYINNYLGTPIAMTDATGTVVWEASYKPFGEALINQNSVVENNFRFPGQYFDKETGLHYNYHRYYDPQTGRYLRPDPIGLNGGINLYAYVSNNPVNYIDPRGESGLPGIVVGMGAGAFAGFVAGMQSGDLAIGLISGVAGGAVGGLVGIFSPQLGYLAAGSIGGFLAGSFGGAISVFLDDNCDEFADYANATVIGGTFGLASGALGGAFTAGAASVGASGIWVEVSASMFSSSFASGSAILQNQIVNSSRNYINSDLYIP